MVDSRQKNINRDLSYLGMASTFSNPLKSKSANEASALENYTQELPRGKYDNDLIEIVEVVRILNNLAPLRMPVYNFNADEINGESFYRPDGSLLLIREYDSDVIRDYYVAKEPKAKDVTIDRVLEHDKVSGRLKAKIEPVIYRNSQLNTNITIYDWKINNKYTLFQLSVGGVINSFTEFFGKGKSFQTLFRNPETFKPARYLEGKDDLKGNFAMLDCVFDLDGKIARIKRYNSKRETTIEYTETKKIITVRTK
ncbi:MAG: hypothetical protein E7Z89_06955 [Cyanobacteria bacterium SIG28]|nr:hypothetical protein [Cyanobacteria bacterium SIG28]